MRRAAIAVASLTVLGVAIWLAPVYFLSSTAITADFSLPSAKKFMVCPQPWGSLIAPMGVKASARW